MKKMPFISIILLAVSLVFFAGEHFSAQEYGGFNTMDRRAVKMDTNIPPLDFDVPTVTETATFALG